MTDSFLRFLCVLYSASCNIYCGDNSILTFALMMKRQPRHVVTPDVRQCFVSALVLQVRQHP